MSHALDIVSTILGLLIVVAALGFAGFRSLKSSEDPAKLVVRWIISVGLIGGGIFSLRGFPVAMWPVVVLIPAMILGVMWAPTVGAIVASPLTGMFDGGTQEVEPQPLYSIAESKRQKGLYAEAAEEVRAQLAKFPGDVKGTVLLGTIMAENFGDLPAARQLVADWLARPGGTPQGTVSVLQNLADWELDVGKDPEAARACLDRIALDYAGTPYAQQALQRMAHLPTVERLRELDENKTVDYTQGEKNIGLRPDYGQSLPIPEENPGVLLESYLEQLRNHPADTDTREKLAMLYADEFQRLDLATVQFEQLIALPTETQKHIVRWLNLLANYQVKLGNDADLAARTLRRIIERFPNGASAEQAFERLASVKGELRANRKTEVKVLGQYEKNVGLKRSKRPETED